VRNTGQKLWEKAKSIIPSGNQLLSKRSELFLPDLWPSYYKKAKGCEIWDLDDNHFYDFSGMGVTSCVLGYADDDVDNAVKSAIDNGSMGTLNSYEEVELAENLIALHPWSEMVRFSRTGGEACAIAIRIARAATGKDHIAFCGYHGWHDWYLAANLSKGSNLDSQLLPGLDTKGVPGDLSGTMHPFQYNDIESFRKILREHGDELAAIIMEPQRGIAPKDNFLQSIRVEATKTNIVLIFDEVSSGFHNNLGGIHLTLGVNPDIAIFAKALGNGYPISAVIGKREVMDIAQDTFISSTMWTERLGFVSALATLKKMELKSVQKNLVDYGLQIKFGLKNISAETGVQIAVNGLDSVPSFSFEYENAVELQTYFTQEMLRRGYLASWAPCATYAWNSEIIQNYLEEAGQIISQIASLKLDVKTKLRGRVKHTTFARLTG
jgi:glutamate-1-semialdehyde 2,1-aminomutase